MNCQPGLVHGLIGPNGTGKTTFLKALARLHRPSQGQVLWQNQDIWQQSSRHMTQQFALVAQFQSPTWPFTVREFIALGRTPHRGWFQSLTKSDWAIVDQAIHRLDLQSRQEQTLTTLSGGEWQRARLALALAQQARVLLLDEPTTHLDPRFQIEFLQQVRDLTQEQGLCTIMTLHDLNLIGPWVDRLAILAHGQLLANGTVLEVLTTTNLLQAFGVRMPVANHPMTGLATVSLTKTTSG